MDVVIDLSSRAIDIWISLWNQSCLIKFPPTLIYHLIKEYKKLASPCTAKMKNKAAQERMNEMPS